MRAVVDGLDGLLDGFISQHWKNRSENFFHHNRVIKGDAVHYSRGNLVCQGIGIASDYSFIWINQSAEAFEMLFINDFPVIGIVKGSLSKLAANLFSDFLNQFIFNRSITVNVIRCNAGLSAV